MGEESRWIRPVFVFHMEIPNADKTHYYEQVEEHQHDVQGRGCLEYKVTNNSKVHHRKSICTI